MLKRHSLRCLPRRAGTAFLAALAALSVVVVVSAGTIAAGPAEPAGATASNCIVTPTDFANAFLADLGMPGTPQNVYGIVAWEEMEGGNWENTAKFNPLNTTYRLTTSVPYIDVTPNNGEPNKPYTPANTPNGGDPVQAFSNWNAGLSATVLTIEGGSKYHYYTTILAALRAGNSDVAVAQAIDNSPWGTASKSNPTAVLNVVRNGQIPQYHPSSRPWELTGCTMLDTSGDGWAAVASTHTTDWCREVGDRNLVDSKLACTPFTGTTYDTTQTSKIADWGYPRDRAWVDVNGDANYCRLVGSGPNLVSSYLECTPFNGTSFGRSVISPVVDWGYTTASAWVQTSSGADYCRLVGGEDLVSSYLECTPFNGTSFGRSVISPVVDWGYGRDRGWVEVNGQADYCRLVGSGPNLVSSYLECTPFNGTSFGTSAISVGVDWGYPTGSQWVSTNSGADYCRRVGSGPNLAHSYLQCTSFNGTAFGSTVMSGVVDWGYNTEWAWVPQEGGVDYCRRGGSGPDLVSSYLECTPFTTTSAGATVITPTVVDWGFSEAQGRWIQGPGGAVDYCRWSARTPRDMSCTAFNWTHFGSTETSTNLIWGYFTGPVK